MANFLTKTKTYLDSKVPTISQVTSGARLVFKVNGAKVLYASVVGYNLAYQYEPNMVLDQLVPAEYAETACIISFTCTMFRVSFRDAVSLGLRPKIKNLVLQPELTAELLDTITGQTLARIERIKCTEEVFDVTARDLGKLTLSFVGIQLFTEGE